MKDFTMNEAQPKLTAQGVELHGAEDFEGMRKAGLLAAQTLDMITDHIAAGVTTNELDRLCADFVEKAGAISAPLNYKGFPKSICTSVNHVVCHGIPCEKALQEGDIINIDIPARTIDVALSDAELARVVERCSFDWMKAHEPRFAPPRMLFTRGHGKMLREGKVGGSHALLSDEQRASIDRWCLSELERLGSDLPYREKFEVVEA